MVSTKIPETSGANFDTLVDAFVNNDICLMRVFDKKDFEEVTIICAVVFDGEYYNFTPFAVMLEENPYDRFIPP